MRVLVIGRSGQVAQSLLERGAEAGVSVEAIGRPDADLARPETLENALARTEADMIINAAAYTAVDAAETDEDAAHALNAQGPGALARLCAVRKVPLIHISTDYVFDGTADRPYREDDPIAPRSAYGRTKADGEKAVADSGADALIVRTAWVYSPFGKNFVRTMLRVGAERDTLSVVADQRGNPTSALDIADALLGLAAARASWPTGAHIVHLSGTGDATWHAFAEAIFEAADLSPTVNAISTSDYPTPAARPANSRLDNTRLREEFGISLPHWRESLPPIVARLLADAG